MLPQFSRVNSMIRHHVVSIHFTDMRPMMPSWSGSPPPPGALCGSGPRMPNPQQPNMAFGNNSDFRPPSTGGMPTTGTDMLRKQLEQTQPSIKSPMNSHSSMGGQSSLGGSSLLMAQLEKQPPCNPDPKLINQVAGSLANKVPTDNLHNLLPNQQPHLSNNQDMKMEIKSEHDIKQEIKDEPMDSFSESSCSNDVPQIKKEEIKHEPDVKKESTSADGASAARASDSASGSSEPTAASKLPLGANKRIFLPEELKKALEPPLMKLYNQEPEAIPFRVPVDPNALGIPDYFEIIKKPMDMASIKRKLDTGGYTDPWEYIDDIWQMFENAWTYNRKTSRVYKYCSKVRELLIHFLSSG